MRSIRQRGKRSCGMLFCVLLSLFSLVGCGGGGEDKTKSELKALGFYAVVDGKAIHIPLKEYKGIDILPVSDFSFVPTITSNNYLIVYGDIPTGPMNTPMGVIPYKKDGGKYKPKGRRTSFQSFFKMEPQSPINGFSVVKLTPNNNVPSGLYFLHNYVGPNGMAYLPFIIKQ